MTGTGMCLGIGCVDLGWSIFHERCSGIGAYSLGIVLDFVSFFTSVHLTRASKVYTSACILHERYWYVSGDRLHSFGVKKDSQKMFGYGCLLPRDMHTYTHIHTTTHTLCMHTHMHPCTHTYIHIHTYILTCIYTQTCMHVFIHMHMHAHTLSDMHTHIHIASPSAKSKLPLGPQTHVLYHLQLPHTCRLNLSSHIYFFGPKTHQKRLKTVPLSMVLACFETLSS